MIPLYLLLFPLVRRDARWCAGCAAGLVLFLLVLPGAVVGPAKAWEYNCAFAEQMLLPHLGLGSAQEKVEELQRTMDNQSLMAVMHSTRNLEEVRAQAVNVRTSEERIAHFVVAGLMTLATVAVGWRRGVSGERADTLFLGLLACVMILSSEVCHLHYFILAMPLLTALVATGWIVRAQKDFQSGCGRWSCCTRCPTPCRGSRRSR